MRNHEILPQYTVLENEHKIFSKRELEIIILIASGFENSQISEIFHVTLSTIKKQLEKIYEKLRARNRAHAVFLAMFHNLISENDFNTIMNSQEVKKFMENNKSHFEKYNY